MFLIRLIYASQISESFKPDDIEEILTEAREFNAKQNVTGMLCFNRKLFLQCLEGSRSKVNEVYQKILADNRHKNPILLDYQEITYREFDHWHMGYVPESSLSGEINMKFSSTPEFTPYEMSGESAHQLFLGLREKLPKL